MSALALIMAKRGYSISGSDQSDNQSIQSLSKTGITIFNSQTASNIDRIYSSQKQKKLLIVISSAIPKTNPELRAARNAKLEIIHRSDLLASLIKSQTSIVVSGSHGKTTTSTLITTLLALTKQDPTAVIGGLVPFYQSNGHAGDGNLLIAEADESDGTIIKFKGDLGVITNLELDHTNHYQDIESLIKTLKKFANNSKILLANFDCPIIRKNFRSSIWWSIKNNQDVDFAAIPISVNGKETIANFYEQGNLIGKIKIPLPGLHNLSNTTAAIAACRLAGIPFTKLNAIVHKLEAPNRRFEFRGSWRKRQLVDDYAHHPSEVSATLAMGRLMIDSGKSILPRQPRRIVAIFQPHRFSRIRDFQKDFAKALKKADLIILAPIYGAGEQAIEGINNESLAQAIKEENATIPIHIAKDIDNLIDLIEEHTQEEDLILNMGAGDTNLIWEKIQLRPKNPMDILSLNEAA